MNALLERKGTQYIVDVAAEVLGNPVFIGDASYKVFLCSNGEEPEDEFWKEVQRKTFPSDKEIIKAFRSEEFYAMYAQDEPVVASFPVIKHRLLGARYRDGNHVMGHIVVYELRKEFEKEDHELLNVLCKVLAYEMLYREKAIMQKVKYCSLFCDLLEGKTIPEQEMKGCLELAHVKLPDHMQLVVMQSSRSTTGVMLNYIREQILNKNIGIMAITYEKKIIFVFGANKEWNDIMEEFCERYSMMCGVSYHFENLCNLHINYRQAVKAIELSHKLKLQKSINTYDSYAIYDLIAGAGLTGSETAVALARKGHKVTQIDMLTLAEIDGKSNASRNNIGMLRGMSMQVGVQVLEKMKLAEVKEKSVICLNEEKKAIELACDTVVLSIGMRSRTAVVDEFKNLVKETHVIGDCNRIGNITSAVREAFYAAMNI